MKRPSGQLVMAVCAILAALFAGVSAFEARRQADTAIDQARIAREQADLARKQARVAEISGFARLASECRTQAPGSARSPTDVWEELCTARRLAYGVLLNDLIRKLAEDGRPLVNQRAAKELSIHLEDGLVRELKAKAASVLRRMQSDPNASAEDMCRIRQVFVAIYMFPHPGSDFGEEVREHREDVAAHADEAHARRLLEFNDILEGFGKECG